MENNQNLIKEFIGKIQPYGQFKGEENVEIEVEFLGITSQEQLNQTICDGDSYEYKVLSIICWDANEGKWLDFTHKQSDILVEDRIDTIISNTIDKEAKAYEQARKNG